MEMWARTWKFSGSLCIWWQSKSKSSFFGRKVAIAIGETVESVCAMQEKERKELMEVLGLKVEKQLDIFVHMSQMSIVDHLPFSRWRISLRFSTVTTSH